MGRSAIKGNLALPHIQAVEAQTHQHQQKRLLIIIFQGRFPWKNIYRRFWVNKKGERFRNPPVDN